MRLPKILVLIMPSPQECEALIKQYGGQVRTRACAMRMRMRAPRAADGGSEDDAAPSTERRG